MSGSSHGGKQTDKALNGEVQSRFKPYPKYKDSGIEWLGPIPEHWDVIRINKMFRIINGSTPKSEKKEYWDGEILWVTPDDLGSNHARLIEDTNRKITEQGYRSCGTHLVQKNSLILSTRAPIGHLAIAGKDLCTNQGCKSLILKEVSNSVFFYYQILAGRSCIEALGRGSTFKELSREDLGNFQMTTPPLNEQDAIADFLIKVTQNIDELIADKERLIELLKEKRAALINQAVTKGLDPNVPMKDSGIEWIGEIPAHWNISKLKYLADVKVSNVDKKSFEGETEVKLCNYTDVYNNKNITTDIDFMRATASLEEIMKFGLRKGDVLITKDSEDWRDIAVPALVDSINGGVLLCGYHLAMIRPKQNAQNSEYTFRALSSLSVNYQFRLASVGITRYGLSRYWLANSFMINPPLEEQTRIADFLKEEMLVVEELEKLIAEEMKRLMEYRSALITAAVTGKIDVRGE